MSYFKDNVTSKDSVCVAPTGNNSQDAVNAIKITGTANAADANVVTLTNASHAQATIITIADCGNAAGTITPAVGGYSPVRSVGAVTAGTTQTQAGATAITKDITVVTTGNANDGVLLPSIRAGQVLVIINASANAGKIYANGTETLNGTAGNAGSTALGASKAVTVVGTAAGVSVSYTN